MSNDAVRILLIEDSPTDAGLIQEMLVDAGDGLPHSVHSVGRCSDGLDWLAGDTTDVVLLDLSLPDSHGLDTLLRVREQASNTPIVVLTGYDDEALGITAMQEGAQDYLVKQRVDTTELVRSVRYALERQRVEMQRVALSIERERVAALKRFIQDASHDIRTPLTTMVTRLYLLRRQLDVAPGTKPDENLSILETQTKRLQRLLDDMLQMSRLDDTSALLKPVPSDLNTLAQIVYDELKSQAIEKRVKTTFEPASDLPSVYIDPEEFGRALRAIASNAINFTPSGGSVQLRTYLQETSVVFAVHDTGVGIAHTEIPKIFERFYRVDQSRSSSNGGTGMGLAIAKRLVELHAGAIEVNSVPGQGSVFRIILPGKTG